MYEIEQVRVDAKLRRRGKAKFMINSLQKFMNRATLQADSICYITANVPDKVILLFLRCGFKKLKEHKTPKEVNDAL
jgi:N-acetylglutamate synthase-like GNAT family acetyltransferase